MNILHIDHDTDYQKSFNTLLFQKCIDFSSQINLFSATDFVGSQNIILSNKIDYIITECFLFYNDDSANDEFENFERLINFISSFSKAKVIVLTLQGYKIVGKYANKRYYNVIQDNQIPFFEKTFPKDNLFELLFQSDKKATTIR